MKKFCVAVIAVMIGFMLAGVARADDALLRWGGDSEGGAPYVFPDPKEPSRIIGFEVDLAEALAKRMGRTAKFEQNQWDSLIMGMNRGSCDVVINGMEITEEHRTAADFSVPYYITYEQLAVRADAPEIKTLDDLKGKKVGTLSGSLAERILQKMQEEGKVAEVSSNPGQVTAYEDLVNGRVDAVMMDAPIAVYYVPRYGGKLKLSGPPIERIEYGIAIPQDKIELTRQVSEALVEMVKSGELKEIYQKWELWNTPTEELFSKLREPNVVDEYMKKNGRKRSASEVAKVYFTKYLPLLLKAAWTTLEISILSMAVAIVLGLGLALVNVYTPPPFSWLARLYIEIFRGTPLLIQLYLIYYGLPYVGITLSPFVAGIVGLGLNYAAYEAENYRAGLEAIPRGQTEAAISLGMSHWQAIRHVVVPQAVRLVIPPVTNDFVALLKDSSIVSAITMVELTKTTYQLANTYMDFLGIGMLAAVIYLLMGLPFVQLSRWAERRLKVDKRKSPTTARRWFGGGGKPARA